MGKKGKLPPQQQNDGLVYRLVQLRATPTQEAIPLVLATDTPVRVWDYATRQVMDEVVMIDGVEMPQQVPLLDSHNRFSSRDVIGSIRDLEKSPSQVVGNAYFASNEDAQATRALYMEGHLQDFSVGLSPSEIMRVDRGERQRVGGKEYSGPVRIITRSRLLEGSAVAVGADPNAKAMVPALRAYLCVDDLKKEYDTMKMRDLCLTRGMPAEIEDEAAVMEWASANLISRSEQEEADQTTEREEERERVAVNEDPVPTVDPLEERKRCSKIAQYCAMHAVSQQQQSSYMSSSLTAEQVAEDILQKIARNRIGDKQLGTTPIISPLESETDKFMDGAKGALIQRCLMGVNVDRAEKHARGEYEHMGRSVQTHFRDQSGLQGVQEVRRLIDSTVADSFRNVGLYDMARMFVEHAGERTWGLSRNEVVKRAFALDFVRRDAAYHTTGSFTNVLLDAAKKTLLMAYEEASVTYPLWVRQAASTTDFKTINRIRLGEIPNPEIVPENAKYGEVAVTDAKESYVVEKYGHIFSISLEAIVNDDLNAISRIPAQQGYAMRRKINALCYAQLTGNPTLSDGVALFHASSHGANLDSNALSVSALNTGWTIMGTQVGLTSGVVLNIQPRFLIVPPALSYTALQIAGSIADPSNTAATTEDASRPNYNSGVLNVYGPNGSRPLTPVIDAAISTSESATAWYLAAEPNQIDTVELTFLQGEETPYLERENSFDVDSVRYKIRQTFGAKPIDYRGLYQGNS